MKRALLLPVLVMVLAAGCGDDGSPVVAPTSSSAPAATSTSVAATTSTAAPGTTARSAPTTTVSPLPAAPWAGAKLRADQVPAVLLQEWRAGGARADCAALAPVDLGPAASGTARRADFGARAWAVAWDVPGAPGRTAAGQPCTTCGRGSVLVAGTGLDLPSAGTSPLPNVRRWADGSVARYGLEGGTGPNHLAQLEVAGQRCLYNVGSFLGQAHLEEVLESLRFVQGAP